MSGGSYPDQPDEFRARDIDDRIAVDRPVGSYADDPDGMLPLIELPDQDWRPRDVDGAFKEAIIYDDLALNDEDHNPEPLECPTCHTLVGEFYPEDEGSTLKCPNCEEEVTVG